MAADEDVPVGVHLQEVPVLAVHHHAAEEQDKGVSERRERAASVLPTVWGSWGRRCSAAAREGTRRTPAGLGSSRSPDSRIRETCTLQKSADARQLGCVGGAGPWGWFTYPPWCSPCRSRSI